MDSKYEQELTAIDEDLDEIHIVIYVRHDIKKAKQLILTLIAKLKKVNKEPVIIFTRHFGKHSGKYYFSILDAIFSRRANELLLLALENKLSLEARLKLNARLIPLLEGGSPVIKCGTLLMRAIYNKDSPLIRLLLLMGANPYACGSDNCNSFILAKFRHMGNELIILLLEVKAVKKITTRIEFLKDNPNKLYEIGKCYLDLYKKHQAFREDVADFSKLYYAKDSKYYSSDFPPSITHDKYSFRPIINWHKAIAAKNSWLALEYMLKFYNKRFLDKKIYLYKLILDKANLDKIMLDIAITALDIFADNNNHREVNLFVFEVLKSLKFNYIELADTAKFKDINVSKFKALDALASAKHRYYNPARYSLAEHEFNAYIDTFDEQATDIYNEKFSKLYNLKLAKLKDLYSQRHICSNLQAALVNFRVKKLMPKHILDKYLKNLQTSLLTNFNTGKKEEADIKYYSDNIDLLLESIQIYKDRLPNNELLELQLNNLQSLISKLTKSYKESTTFKLEILTTIRKHFKELSVQGRDKFRKTLSEDKFKKSYYLLTDNIKNVNIFSLKVFKEKTTNTNGLMASIYNKAILWFKPASAVRYRGLAEEKSLLSNGDIKVNELKSYNSFYMD